MPDDQPALGEIALAYLRNLREVEGARRLFEEERERLLKTWEQLAANAADKAGKKPLKQLYRGNDDRDSYAFFDVYLGGQYVALRKKRGRSKESGYQVTLSERYGVLGFQALVFFGLSERSFRRIGDPPTNLLGGQVFETFYEQAFLYFRVAKIAPDDPRFLPDEFQNAIQRLPDDFERFDGWVAKEYAASRGDDEDS